MFRLRRPDVGAVETGRGRDGASAPRTDGFHPPRWMAGPHLQTILPTLLPGPALGRGGERRTVHVANGCAVRVDVDRPGPVASGTLVLVHGMCGSSESVYVRRTARQALARGWITARMNLRNCGGTEHLSTTLYNAAQSGDLGRVLEELDAEAFPRPLLVVGFSLGGNIALRHAALEGDACRADAVATLNPPIDLEICARAIERPSNRLYRAYYTRGLCVQLRRIARVRPVAGPPRPVARRIRTVRRFDALYTAPDGGFDSAEAYYAEASAGPRLAGIRRPTLILSAADDPFVPREIFDPYRGTPRLELLQPSRGGHCGYWQRGRPRYWAGSALLEFLASAARPG